ncbi:uncharacterized protein LOC125221277 [Salvia hispanica]|uniref:uncharacterized protein LOC125221277 n=1 Tax=Salvia hispanica TaxID=49212 RepID=UPI00200989DE|nr:uncharacterized protein LOC125221277 [Salvia hispanica]
MDLEENGSPIERFVDETEGGHFFDERDERCSMDTLERLLWDDFWHIEVLDTKYQFIHCLVRDERDMNFRFNAVYGHLFPSRRDILWQQLAYIQVANDLLLFGKADVVSAENVAQVLDEFCTSSGMKVSTTKTTISFSKNVKNETRRNLKELLGVREVQGLGKYLGVPLLHRRVNKNTYAYIVDIMKGKIANWTIGRMSLAGKVSLAQSMLSTMPLYAMQTAKIPIGTCDEMEKVIRGFVMSMVAWDMVTCSREEGGLGLRNLHLVNNAFGMKAVDFFVDSSGLAWDMFERFVPAEVASIIAATSPPRAMEEDDVAFWGPSSTGDFTVKTAYDSLARVPESVSYLPWARIWNWYGPQRIKAFFWLLLKNGVLVNTERRRSSKLQTGSEVNSCTIFGVGCWSVWKKMCGFVLNNERLSSKPVISQTIIMAKNVEYARMAAVVGEGLPRQPVSVFWQPPLSTILKLNTNASLEKGTGRAYGGGLFRDVLGQWGQGLLQTLENCKKDENKNVEVENDNPVVVALQRNLR